MNIQTILNWLVNVGIVPGGWLGKLGGWLAVITAVLCMSGHPVKWLPCDATVTTIGAPATHLSATGVASEVPASNTSSHLPLAPLLLVFGIDMISRGRKTVTAKGTVYAAGVKAAKFNQSS